ncbi:MAG: CotH kinase family protein [Lachnospiraceae bacterium]|nr:CotH kinase family protein [Lachnospiraceae bacterium]
MKKRIPALIISLLLLILCLAACTGKTPGTGETGSSPTEAPDGGKASVTKQPTYPGQKKPSPTPTLAPLPVDEDSYEEVPAAEPSVFCCGLRFGADGRFAFDRDSTFYTTDVELTIEAPAGAVIYYTLDGREPGQDSSVYSEPLTFEAHGGSFPDAVTLRAKVLYADGTWSDEAARTFLAGTKLTGRFSTLVFSVCGDPDELTEGPDGIFFGENYKQRGRTSERKVFIEVWDEHGENLISQFGGVRIYGGYSRQSTIKSMKLFSRKSYDPEHKNFKLEAFETPKLDGSNEYIRKYDKLVLRNCGNDNQFAFIRDELSQLLAKKAGFECYEAVLPAVTYLNGSYYNFYWLHENYCDKYFREKFGDAEGEFVVLEGKDQIKDDDDEYQNEVDTYNKAYARFSTGDLTDDKLYAELCEFMDVESYLDVFAWNISLNNWDWPNNNFKCYRYVEADERTLNKDDAVLTPSSEQFDGRWRYLLHDMDYAYGLYNQDKTQANYNILRVVMNKNNERYSPLFTALMQRRDCRDYFRGRVYEFCKNSFSENAIISAYKELHATREKELSYYYEFLERVNRKGDSTIWTTEDNYAGNEEQIFEFARERSSYALQHLEELLPAITDEPAAVDEPAPAEESADTAEPVADETSGTDN